MKRGKKNAVNTAVRAVQDIFTSDFQMISYTYLWPNLSIHCLITNMLMDYDVFFWYF